jgi:DNA repair protein SbcD/Mre11
MTSSKLPVSPTLSSSSANSPDLDTLRICHLADVHLGYRRYNKLTRTGQNQREADVNAAFQEAIGRIVALRPALTVIAGDLFHSVRPSNAVVTFCFRQIRRLQTETGAPVIVVAGNHEQPKRLDTGSPLRLLAEIPGVLVSDGEADCFPFPELDLSVQCLPHAAIADGTVPKLRADDRFRHSVLVAHAQVEEEWVSEFGGITLALDRLNPREWNYIALGHVHLFHALGLNAAYSGSVEHTALNIWSEGRAKKGFVEVDLKSGQRTFHVLTSPREVVVLEPLNAFGLSPEDVSTGIALRVGGIGGGVEGKIVRLEVTNLSREVYRYLDHKALRNYRGQALNFSLDVRAPGQEAGAAGAPRERAKSLREELVSFCAVMEESGSVPRRQITDTLIRYLDITEAEREAS